MTENDFSRIGEIYAREISEKNKSCELSEMIRYSMQDYVEKCRFHRDDAPLEYTYSAGEETLRLNMELLYGLPALKRLVIDSETTDISSIIHLMRGEIKAEYDGLDIDKIPKGLDTGKIIGGFSYSYIHSYVYMKKDDGWMLQMVSRQVPRGREFRSILLEDKILSDEELQLFAMANRINIKNYFYQNNNPNSILMKERCVMSSNGDGKFRVEYVYGTDADASLDMKIFPMMNTIFRLLTKKFDESIYHTCKKAEKKGSNND